MPLRSLHLVALGCPKNRVDAEVCAGLARELGLEIVPSPGEADAIVVYTCGFVEPAKRESIDVLLEMARLRTEGRCRLLVSASCLSQRYAGELARELPEVDLFVGTQEPRWLERVLDGDLFRVEVGPAGHFLQRPGTPRMLEPGAASAYLKIADGCSRRCAFCAIPAIRGPMRSRPIDEIVDEARELARCGVSELVLVSQDTAAYGRDLDRGASLVALLRALDGVPGLRWVRPLYLYPDGVDDELLGALVDLRSAVPYLDVPIQHASARMLRRMRRGHGPGRLHSLLERTRRVASELFLRTTVLVGHPGESAEDFDELLRFVERARFHHLGAFRYSDEEGTPAFAGRPAVPPRDSYNRQRRVLAVQRRISRARNRELLGRELEVLIERPADESGYVMVGRHAGQAPEIDGVTYLVSCPAAPGEMVRARAIRAGDFDLVAEPC